ncbi:MAG TPA: TrkA C-terminal domain-containing protein [Thermoleophilia bacterium]|nr:TrkA C-terminal domain-containing protein [Thermoleophilia bacterium]
MVDEAGRFEGVLAGSSLAAPDAGDRTAGDLADSGAPTVSASSRLDSALESLMDTPLSWVSVLDADRRVVGTLSISDLLTAYRRELLASVARVGGLGQQEGASEVEIRDDSPAVGRPLHAIGLPRGVLVTSIARAGEVVLPSGDTVVLAGDRLSVLGKVDGLGEIGAVTDLR